MVSEIQIGERRVVERIFIKNDGSDAAILVEPVNVKNATAEELKVYCQKVAYGQVFASALFLKLQTLYIHLVTFLFQYVQQHHLHQKVRLYWKVEKLIFRLV